MNHARFCRVLPGMASLCNRPSCRDRINRVVAAHYEKRDIR